MATCLVVDCCEKGNKPPEEFSTFFLAGLWIAIVAVVRRSKTFFEWPAFGQFGRCCLSPIFFTGDKQPRLLQFRIDGSERYRIGSHQRNLAFGYGSLCP